MKKSTVHTLTFENGPQLSEEEIKKYNEMVEKSNQLGYKIVAQQDMDTIGTGKAKESLLTRIDKLEKKSESRRKQVEYWRDKSNSWEEKFFFVQDQMNAENQEIIKKLETIETKYKWANEAHKIMKQSNEELLERCRLAESGELVSKMEVKNKKVEVMLMKSDLEFYQNEFETLKKDHEDLHNDQKYTRILAWVGWIMFFTTLFVFIFRS
jgi:hypothetical protein